MMNTSADDKGRKIGEEKSWDDPWTTLTFFYAIFFFGKLLVFGQYLVASFLYVIN